MVERFFFFHVIVLFVTYMSDLLSCYITGDYVGQVFNLVAFTVCPTPGQLLSLCQTLIELTKLE